MSSHSAPTPERSFEPLDRGTQLRVFFLHIMKTGGTTLSFRFRGALAENEVFPAREAENGNLDYWDPNQFKRRSAEERASYRLVMGHFPYYMQEHIRADLVVTYLRDPVDRVISHLRQNQRLAKKMAGLPLETIYEYVPGLSTYQARTLGAHEENPNGPVDDTVFQRAREALEQIHIVGTTESSDELARRVEIATGWTLPPISPQMVSGPGEEASASLRKKIWRDSEMDRELYARAQEMSAKAASL